MRFSPERSEKAAAGTGSGTSTDAPAGDGAPASDGANEIVVRPEPGLARGAWEAPAWAFWAVLAVALAGAALYAARRFGLWRFDRGSRP